MALKYLKSKRFCGWEKLHSFQEPACQRDERLKEKIKETTKQLLRGGFVLGYKTSEHPTVAEKKRTGDRRYEARSSALAAGIRTLASLYSISAVDQEPRHSLLASHHPPKPAEIENLNFVI